VKSSTPIAGIDSTAPRVLVLGAGFSSAVRSFGRVLQLSASKDHRAVRFLSGAQISLDEGETESWITLTRTGTFYDERYGDFEITAKQLDQMVANFDAGVLGQKVFVDVQHRPDQGAAAEILKLSRENKRLRALVRWTEYGLDAVRRKKMIYLSAEFHENYRDNEQRKAHGAVLMGAGLTTRPVIKHLDPVELSDIHLTPDSIAAGPTLLHPELVRQLSNDWSAKMDKHLKALAAALAALSLSKDAVESLTGAYKLAAANVGDDEDKLKALADQFEATGKKLAAAKPGENVTLTIEGLPKAGEKPNDDGGGKALSAEDLEKAVAKQLAEARKAEEDERKQLAQNLDARKKTFSDTVDQAEGLSDDTKKELCKQVDDLITVNMSDDQVRRLAEFQVKQAHDLEAARQLAAQGYGDSRTGTPRMGVDESNGIKKLSSEIHTKLKGTSEYMQGKIRLAEPDKLHPFAKKVLSHFDQLHAPKLHRERQIILAEGGNTQVSDTDLPVSFMREVITEIFSDTYILQLVQTLTDFGATGTTQIPYEEQGDAASIPNDGIVYERGPIPRSGVRQRMDMAYLLPMKLAMILSVEVMHLTRASQINWDAWARNLAANARIMRELVARRILNELQRVADQYQAVDVEDEEVHSQLDGTNSVITLAQYPLVRPFQQYDMEGNAVGSVENPISVNLTIGGSPTTITAWDGTGDQSAGTYYRVVSYNLAKLQLVDKDGNPDPQAASASAVGYSYATNVGKFNLDFNSAETTLEKHLNGLLRAIGSRKATMNSDLRGVPDYQFMSPTLNDICTNAENFTAHSKRDGTDTSAQGDLETVKGIPAFGSNAPGVDLGDERILMGQRGMLSYTIARPWSIDGQPVDYRDANGSLTGEKEAWGWELSAIKVPKPLRKRHTSVIVHTTADRTPYSP
jgi:hypothetical protein